MSNSNSIETAYEFLATLNESLDSYRDISENDINSVESYSGMFSLAGIVSSIFSNQDHPLVKTIGSELGKKNKCDWFGTIGN